MLITDALADTLAKQHQVVTWPQLRDGVGSRWSAERLVRDGVFLRTRPNVLRLAGSSPTFHQQVMSAVLACGDGALAARHTATFLHGLRTGTPPQDIQVVVPHRRTPDPLLPGVRRHRSRTLRPEDATEVAGIPTCSAARAVVDLAINLGASSLRDLVARGLREDALTLAGMSEQLEAAGRIRGASRLRVALSSLDDDAEAAGSRAEQVLHDALVAAGLGPVERQYPIDLPSGRAYLDLALVGSRTAVEVDGYWWHSTPKQKAADERRQNEIVAANWRPVRLGAGFVVSHTARAVAQVRAVVSGRAD